MSEISQEVYNRLRKAADAPGGLSWDRLNDVAEEIAQAVEVIYSRSRSAAFSLITEERCELAIALIDSLIEDDPAGPHLIDASEALREYQEQLVKTTPEPEANPTKRCHYCLVKALVAACEARGQ